MRGMMNLVRACIFNFKSAIFDNGNSRQNGQNHRIVHREHTTDTVCPGWYSKSVAHHGSTRVRNVFPALRVGEQSLLRCDPALKSAQVGNFSRTAPTQAKSNRKLNIRNPGKIIGASAPVQKRRQRLLHSLHRGAVNGIETLRLQLSANAAACSCPRGERSMSIRPPKRVDNALDLAWRNRKDRGRNHSTPCLRHAACCAASNSRSPPSSASNAAVAIR